MNETPKNREWVKNAAIVFLAVLLVLTFFSNTIMNRSLPEVATQDVTDGAIVSKVRGSGTVTANGNNQVKMEKTRVIRAVLVKAGPRRAMFCSPSAKAAAKRSKPSKRRSATCRTPTTVLRSEEQCILMQQMKEIWMF